MAVIETPQEAVMAATETTPAARPAPTGLAAVLGTGDHKVIGRLYIAAALLFALLMVGLSVAMGVERTGTDSIDIFSDETAFQAFTLGRFGLVMLVALPLLIGVALVVTPLQIGSRALAFPRAAAASFWAWFLGGILFIASFLINGGPGGGSDRGVELWISSFGLMIVALLLAAVCLATTVLALRTEGMASDDVPFFSWSVLVASTMWLLTLPVALAQLVIAYVGFRNGGVGGGANAAMAGNFGWFLRNPQVYLVAVPVLGLAVDVIASTTATRVSPRNAATGAIAAAGIFGFGAFLAASGAEDHKAWVVVALGVAAVLPVLAILGLVGDLFRRGKVAINGAAIYAIAGLLVLALTVVAGAIASIPRFEVIGSTTDMAVNHGAAIAALITGLGAVHWWATKIGRQSAVENAGRLAPVLLLAGGVLVVAADVISALTGSDEEIYAVDYAAGVEGLNVLVAIGFGLVLIGLILAIASFAPLLKKPLQSARDPWGGQTLEWLAPSPPPLENFDDDLPVVTSPEPLIDLREEK